VVNLAAYIPSIRDTPLPEWPAAEGKPPRIGGGARFPAGGKDDLIGVAYLRRSSGTAVSDRIVGLNHHW
jgi:hypothetical protein